MVVIGLSLWAVLTFLGLLTAADQFRRRKVGCGGALLECLFALLAPPALAAIVLLAGLALGAFGRAAK